MKTLNAFTKEIKNEIVADLADLQNRMNSLRASGVDIGDLSDKYHSFNELYKFRLMYNAHLFNEWFAKGVFNVHKSMLHNDGEKPFGKDDTFIVCAMLDTGLITNHYKIEHWDKFKCEETPKAKFEYDGHTPQDVLYRMSEQLNKY